MKKYNVNELLKMDNCDNIFCDVCPFLLKEYNEKYNHWCKAVIYCIENNINFNFLYEASYIYIKHLKKIELIKMAMEL